MGTHTPPDLMGGSVGEGADETAAGPDFVCIGAQKAGTTWIHDRLISHPEVWIPPTKELHYFDTICPNEDLLGVEPYHHAGILPKMRAFRNRPTYSTIRWLLKFSRHTGTADWYRSLFAEGRDHTCGEFTPAYSTLDDRGVRFARTVLKPGCRIFLVLRNPVDRTWSSFKMYYRWLGRDLGLPSPEAALQFANAPRNRLRSDYPRIVETWTRRFGDDLRVFLYDDLVESPADLLNSVCGFIGIGRFDPEEVSERRSNADPSDLEMPPDIRDALVQHFQDSIVQLDRLVPGIAARWSE